MISRILSIVCLGFLVSCQPITNTNFMLQNNSSTTIYATGDIIFHNQDSANVVQPDNTTILGQYTARGKTLGTIKPTEVLGNDVIIVNEAGDTCTKSYETESQWEYESQSDSRVTTHNYTFIVENDDF